MRQATTPFPGATGQACQADLSIFNGVKVYWVREGVPPFALRATEGRQGLGFSPSPSGLPTSLFELGTSPFRLRFQLRPNRSGYDPTRRRDKTEGRQGSGFPPSPFRLRFQLRPNRSGFGGQAARPPAKKTASLIKKETLIFERKRGMDSYLKNLDRTCLPCKKNLPAKQIDNMTPLRKKLGNA